MRKKLAPARKPGGFKAANACLNNARYVLKLYVIGSTQNSGRAIVNVRKMCEEHLQGRYDLEIVDVSQHPALAMEEQIIAAPTLIKKQPLPLRRFIGDMSQSERMLLGFDLRKTTEKVASDKDH